MKTMQELSKIHDADLNKRFAHCGKVFASLHEAENFAKGKPNARITALRKGVEKLNPKSTQGLHKLTYATKRHLGTTEIHTHWFDRVPTGEYLVSLV